MADSILVLLLRRRRAAPHGPRASSLVAAALAAVLADPDLCALLGEGPGTPKVFQDEATGSPALPWLVVEEQAASIEHETVGLVGGNLVVAEHPRGILDWTITAATKGQARAIRRALAAVLNAADLASDSGDPVLVLVDGQDSPVAHGIAPGVPFCFEAALSLSYILERPASYTVTL